MGMTIAVVGKLNGRSDRQISRNIIEQRRTLGFIRYGQENELGFGTEGQRSAKKRSEIAFIARGKTEKAVENTAEKAAQRSRPAYMAFH